MKEELDNCNIATEAGSDRREKPVKAIYPGGSSSAWEH